MKLLLNDLELGSRAAGAQHERDVVISKGAKRLA
jgi:hypothetical protein